mmetsp:Transcript_49970/g.154428  ORF Transcript_49970/g.154428 Transcript_49970/m.154428 type:complete len:276 (+) Transcript_49970:177-1004(+)
MPSASSGPGCSADDPAKRGPAPPSAAAPVWPLPGSPASPSVRAPGWVLCASWPAATPPEPPPAAVLASPAPQAPASWPAGHCGAVVAARARGGACPKARGVSCARFSASNDGFSASCGGGSGCSPWLSPLLESGRGSSEGPISGEVVADPSARALRRPAAEQIGLSRPGAGTGASKSRNVFFTVHPSEEVPSGVPASARPCPPAMGDGGCACACAWAWASDSACFARSTREQELRDRRLICAGSHGTKASGDCITARCAAAMEFWSGSCAPPCGR